MQQIVDFILELDKLKGVTRKIRPLGLDRYESSAEHSWQLALLAASLAHHAEAALWAYLETRLEEERQKGWFGIA